MYWDISCINIFLSIAIHSYRLQNTATQSYTQLYRAIYTQLRRAIQGSTQLSRALHSYTELYSAVQANTQLYRRAIHSYAGLYRLCISQFQLRPALSPPRATAGHLPVLLVPGVGLQLI